MSVFVLTLGHPPFAKLGLGTRSLPLHFLLDMYSMP